MASFIIGGVGSALTVEAVQQVANGNQSVDSFLDPVVLHVRGGWPPAIKDFHSAVC